MNFKLKLKIRTLFGRMSRTFTVIFTVFLSTFICALGFALNDSVDKLVNGSSESANVYNYSYYLNEIKLDEDFGGEKGIIVPFETGDEGSRINLSGVPTDSKFDDLEIISGSKVQDGYYITNVIAKLFDLAPGDEITITHSVSMEETTVKIDGIIGDNTQPILYTSYDNAKEILGLSDNYFNVVYSDNALDIDSNEISYMGDSESSLDTLMIALSAFYLFIYGMMILGCVISVISIYLIVNLLIKESETNISMFKVLGYRNREINGIFLTVNHILIPIGFALAIPVTLAAINELCTAMIFMVNVVMTPAINDTSICICAAIILLSYLFSLLLLRGKIDKVDLTVSLKGNRE
jgi:putative ABC transport system permease protein